MTKPKPQRRKARRIDRETLERFLRAGGVLSLSEFLTWDRASQEAAAVVGDGITGERIYALSLSIQDAGAREAMLAPKDNGKALQRSLVDMALDLAEERLRLECDVPPAQPVKLGVKKGG